MNETWTNVTKKARMKIDKALIEISPASSITTNAKKEREHCYCAPQFFFQDIIDIESSIIWLKQIREVINNI